MKLWGTRAAGCEVSDSWNSSLIESYLLSACFVNYDNKLPDARAALGSMVSHGFQDRRVKIFRTFRDAPIRSMTKFVPVV